MYFVKTMRKLISTSIIVFLAFTVNAQKLLFFNSKKLPETINSELAEVLPILSSDGNTLYFVRDGLYGGEGSEDIWYSKKDANGNWSEALNDLDNLNNKESNFIIGSSRANNKIYLRNAYDKKQKKVISIAASNFENGQWQEPYNVPALPDFGFRGRNYSMYISHNEENLFISMNIPGTLGAEDLYLLRKKADNTWTQPIHLGDNVNSKGVEMSPFITEDGEHLFFASNGHGGFGDMDIFYSHRLDDTYENWSEPINLGKNINSSGFDAYFHVSHDNTVFYCSTRGEAQYDDIYISEMHIFEQKKRKVVIYDINNYEVITDNGGNEEKKFRFVNIEPLKDYLVTNQKDTSLTGDLADFEYDIVFQLDSGSELKEKLMRLKNVKGYESLEQLLVEEKFLEGEALHLENLDAILAMLTDLEEGVETKDSSQVNTASTKKTIIFYDTDNIELKDLKDGKEIKKHKFVNISSLNDYLIKHKDEVKLAGNTSDFVYDILFDLNDDGELKEKLIRLKNIKGHETLEQLYVAEKIITGDGKPTGDISLVIQFIDNLNNLLAEDNQAKESNPFTKGMLIKTVYHDYDSDRTKSISLTDIINVLKVNPNLKISIESHTDSKGSEEYNINLSKRRAASCETFLLRNGISKSKIDVKGFGETKPIEPNINKDGSDNPNGRAKNRRTEFRVISN